MGLSILANSICIFSLIFPLMKQTNLTLFLLGILPFFYIGLYFLN